ncbi:MAG: hypothetical protein GTN40_00465 [Candidatus Aenigmarchaeota archaeon]|nr:hypothetical protein [Candidatus Aenigmarchaeota archaeon]NIO44059.1 hypothetical protein [Candidatus Aenigmarchaeota archaeon]
MVNIIYFQEMWASIWYNFVTNFPLLLWAIIWLLIGFIVGKIGGWLVKQFLVKMKLDQYVFERDKFKMKLSDIFAALVRWILYLSFILVAATYLTFAPQLANLITYAIGFLGGVVEATIIIVIGYSLSYYIKEQVIKTKTLYGDIVGNVIFFLILYVSVALALPFVGIDTQLINWILIVVVASLGLGMAIAIGLGLKDVVRDIGKNYSKRFMKKRRK